MGDAMGPASRLGGWGAAFPTLNFTYTWFYATMYSMPSNTARQTQGEQYVQSSMVMAHSLQSMCAVG
jgi:hypothetical protein